MKKNCILILDYKGNINVQNTDSRARHKHYGEILSARSTENELNLVVISSGDVEEFDSSDYAEFYQIRCAKYNPIKFIFTSRKTIKNNGLNAKVLVCGDPWESFLIAKAVQCLLRNKPKLQVQIHADISDSNWHERSLKRKIRSKFQLLAIKSSDQVRVVSEKLKDYVQSIDESKEVVIAPIPIRLKRKREFRDLRKRNALVQIGFFGRLHPDRGTKELVKVVEKLNVQRDDFRIVMAGEGPDKDFLIRSLSEILSEDRFTYLGYLDHDTLGIQLEYLDVYLSLAPAESYGLGIREAVLFGVPVVAIESNGSIHAQSEFGNQNISIIRADISPSELSSIVDRALLTVNRGDVEKVIEKENEINVEKLIKSWLALSSIPLN